MTPDEVTKADAALRRLLKAVKAKADLEAEDNLYALATDYHMEKPERDAALAAVKQVLGERYTAQIAALTQEAVAAGVDIKDEYLAAAAAEQRRAIEEARARHAASAQGQIVGGGSGLGSPQQQLGQLRQ